MKSINKWLTMFLLTAITIIYLGLARYDVSTYLIVITIIVMIIPNMVTLVIINEIKRLLSKIVIVLIYLLVIAGVLFIFKQISKGDMFSALSENVRFVSISLVFVIGFNTTILVYGFVKR